MNLHLVTLREASGLIDIHAESIRRLCHHAKVRAWKIDGMWQIDRADLIHWWTYRKERQYSTPKFGLASRILKVLRRAECGMLKSKLKIKTMYGKNINGVRRTLYREWLEVLRAMEDFGWVWSEEVHIPYYGGHALMYHANSCPISTPRKRCSIPNCRKAPTA